MTRAQHILVILTLAGLLSCPGTWLDSTEIPPDWKIENQRWSGPTEAAEIIEIRNLHGDLRVRPTDEEEISLSATTQRHADDPRRAEIQTYAEGSSFHVEVLYPEVDDIDPAHSSDAWSKRRVDMTVFVPAKRQLIIETARGLIEVKGLDRGISARSQGGHIVLTTAGPVIAFTERGSITARFTDTDWKTAIELETLTGSIAVTLPPTADTSVTMTTYGEMTTDFSLTIDRQPGSDRKTGRAHIGTGKSELSVTSNRGNLKLLRAPF